MTGCGKATEKTEDTSSVSASAQVSEVSEKTEELKDVTLKFYMVGDKQKDTDLVLAEINKKLVEKLHATMELSYISWGDLQNKYPLVFASGDDFDAIFASSWTFYAAQAQKNGFLELTDEMLQKNAPNVWANTPKDSWNQVRYNGKVFMVPHLIKEFYAFDYGIRGDLREKYNIPEVKDFDGLDAYFEAIAKNEKGTIPISVYSVEGMMLKPLVNQWSGWAVAGNNINNQFISYKIADTTSKIFSILDTPEYVNALKKVREWNQKGYIAKSTLTQKTFTTDLMKNGKTAFMVHNIASINGVYTDAKKNHPDWIIEAIGSTSTQPVLSTAANNGGLGIHATSKNADRILMVVDYLRYDKDMNYLAQRGIKGKHWDLVGDGSNENIVKPGPDATSYGDSFTWGPWRNSDFQAMPDPATTVKGYTEIFNSMDSRMASPPMQVFNFDDTNVKNEMAAIKSVSDQYIIPLEMGFVDVDSGLATLKEKLKQAGFDKIMAEYQKQADEFIKNYK